MEWLFGSSGSSDDAAVAAAPLSASTTRGRSAPSEEDDSQHRARGNELFQRREFEAAASEYALGIARRPTATLLSNRSAALCALGRFQEALEDAERAAELDPRWAKTYSRKGKALYGLRSFRKAADAYARGLELCLQGAQSEANQRDAELEALKRQTDSQAQAYVRLLEENAQLKRQVEDYQLVFGDYTKKHM